jgi:hypothetical protein
LQFNFKPQKLIDGNFVIGIIFWSTSLKRFFNSQFCSTEQMHLGNYPFHFIFGDNSIQSRMLVFVLILFFFSKNPSTKKRPLDCSRIGWIFSFMMIIFASGHIIRFAIVVPRSAIGNKGLLSNFPFFWKGKIFSSTKEQ